MKEITIIFPHQLFKEHPAVKPGRDIYLTEEALFFNQYNFNRQKIILHRASMKAYSDYLSKKNLTIKYIEAISALADIRNLIKELHKEGVTAIYLADVADDWLRKRIRKACINYDISIVEYPTPNFLNTLDGVNAFFDKKKTYFQTDFYIAQRRQRNILMTSGGHPEGGQWSFDEKNRLRFPKTAQPPVLCIPAEDTYVREAKDYAARNFVSNYGNGDKFIYPVNFEGAERWLDEFLEKRLKNFGAYQDAIVAEEHFLHHAVLTPMLNTGLLCPQQIIDKALSAAPKYQVPLNSLEGFIRQILGWREFVRIVYERAGGRQRTKNYWHFKRKIPQAFWQGNTGIVPVDSVIKKVLDTGYSHHIERLMVMGNFMLLCEFDPDEVYRWFMEMYVDAYDWVMVPNVYGMTQFADGGLMSTKPYISGSNYLMKMSDYPKGAWTETWDALFWRFMHVHRDFFLNNPRLSMLIKTFDKWPAEKRNRYLATGEDYLAKLEQG